MRTHTSSCLASQLRTALFASACALVMTGSACDGDTAQATRAGNSNPAAAPTSVQAAPEAAPAKISPTQAPNLVREVATEPSVPTHGIANLDDLRAAASKLEQERPEFYATIWNLEPGMNRARMPRFAGTAHHDPDAALIFALRLSDPGQPHKAALAQVLPRTGAPHAHLSTLLLSQESDAVIRSALVETLAKVAPAQAEAGLIAGLKDSDARVRAAAAEAFGHQSTLSEAVQGQLLTALDDTDPQVLAATIRTLGVKRVAVAARRITAYLGSDDATLRLQALRALRRMGPDALAQVDLQGLSKDKDASVAAEATRMLAATPKH